MSAREKFAVAPDLLRPGLRVVIAGTRRAARPLRHGHYYGGAGNKFYVLLHESGLVPELLEPADDARLPSFGVGLTDLERSFDEAAGRETVVIALVGAFESRIRRARPSTVAFVSKTAATIYARAVGERAPSHYGPTAFRVAGRPGFVLPGPSGANNGMPLPLRIALWRDLADHLDLLEHPS